MTIASWHRFKALLNQRLRKQKARDGFSKLFLILDGYLIAKCLHTDAKSTLSFVNQSIRGKIVIFGIMPIRQGDKNFAILQIDNNRKIIKLFKSLPHIILSKNDDRIKNVRAYIFLCRSKNVSSNETILKFTSF